MNKFTTTTGAATSKIISRRMFILTTAKAVVLVGVLARLISLQINETSKYKTLSDKNRFREWKLAPERGIIRDYFNNELASNKQVYQIHLIPENVQNIEVIFFRLKSILDLSEKKILSIRKKIAKQKPWDSIIIEDNLNWADFSKLNLYLYELQGLEPVVSVARVYEDNSSAHVLGYVSQVSAKDLKNKEYLRKLRKNRYLHAVRFTLTCFQNPLLVTMTMTISSLLYITLSLE